LFEQSNLEALARHFQALSKVKLLRSGEYPYMPVFKLSHFYCPALFPIYDTDVIWNRALSRRFQSDWRRFNDRESPLSQLTWDDPRWRGLTGGARDFDQPGIYFCLEYLLWASKLIRNSHTELMNQFEAFLIAEGGEEARLLNQLQPLNTYFAAAFEMILIGASTIE
jgi:hypothetical protein